MEDATDAVFLEQVAAELDLDSIDPFLVTGSVEVETDPDVDSLPSGVATEAPSKSNKKETKLYRDEKNAARCRRHRQKKKELEEQTYKDNLKLKREREEYLKKITELEFEVETLRGQGVMDLAKENELLKAEIKKHKSYIDRVVDVALRTPLEVEEEENIRLMSNGVESGTAHIVGLTYSSIHSASWKEAKQMTLRLSDDLTISNVRTWYQLLPLGASLAEARRVNTRTEIQGIPLDWEKLANAYWKNSSTEEILQRQVSSMDFAKHLRLELVAPRIRLSDQEEMICLCVTNDEKKAQNFFVSAVKEVEMYSLAFPQTQSGVQSSEAQKVKIILSSSCNAEPREVPKDLDNIRDINTDGFVFRKGENGGCSITVIGSTPLKGEYYEIVVDGTLNEDPYISEDGELSATHRECLETQLKNTLLLYDDPEVNM